MKKYIMLLLILALTTVGMLGVCKVIGTMQTLKNADNNYTVVIDSGHGGIDPGKIGINGAYEKDINLSIAIALKELLVERKCNVIMTRESDIGLYQEDDSNKKISDLNKRVEIMNSNDADLVVSIHQNSFTQESSKGAQVFYYTSSEAGKALAEIMQKQLVNDLDKDNNRVAKPNSDYYILKNSEPTAIIVECGFLSNSEEAALLCSKEYQEKAAKSIADGIMKYLEGVGDADENSAD